MVRMMLAGGMMIGKVRCMVMQTTCIGMIPSARMIGKSTQRIGLMTGPVGKRPTLRATHTCISFKVLCRLAR